MKFLHTADWHIGKKLHDFSLIAEQKDAFEQLEAIAVQENVDAIVIAGDLYDRTVPSEEAVKLLGQMTTNLNLKHHLPIYAINGNHDSAVRLNIGAKWFKYNNFIINTQLKDAFEPIENKDTQFFLLPYFELSLARDYFKDPSIHTMTDALKLIIKQMMVNFDANKQHVLVAHFFAAGSTHRDSETQVEVGGLDPVPLDLLAPFDYVALGHLHNKNAIHHEHIKYSGSLTKFSVSEAHDEKGFWIVDTDKPSDQMAQWYPVTPKNDIVILEDCFENLIDPQNYHQVSDDDFVAVELTDQEIIPNVMNRLREYYPKIISFKRKNGRQKTQQEHQVQIRKLAPLDLMKQFFHDATGNSLSDEQLEFAQKTLTEIEKNGELR